MRYYNSQHLWIESTPSGRFRLGLSSQAIHHLQEIVVLFFPPELLQNRTCHPGDLLAVMESTKSAIDIDAPCKLTDLLVNEELLQTPQLLHEGAWLVEATLAFDPVADGWMNSEQYDQFLNQRAR